MVLLFSFYFLSLTHAHRCLTMECETMSNPKPIFRSFPISIRVYLKRRNFIVISHKKCQKNQFILPENIENRRKKSCILKDVDVKTPPQLLLWRQPDRTDGGLASVLALSAKYINHQLLGLSVEVDLSAGRFGPHFSCVWHFANAALELRFFLDRREYSSSSHADIDAAEC